MWTTMRTHFKPRRFKRQLWRERGFTLLELLVVLLIVALLAGYVGPKLFNQLSKAKQQTAANQIKSISDALDRYRLDMGTYPSTEQGLGALIQKPVDANEGQWQGPYLNKGIPKDPWNHDYVYQSPGPNGQEFTLLTYGSDGKPGGEGEAADVSH